MEQSNKVRNRFCFGMGTIGRDMVYTLVSMYLIFYLTDVLRLSDAVILNITWIMVAARVFDTLNDPFMGVIVDNTRSRWGKFKPWIFSGAILSAILTVLLFTDFGLSGSKYAVLFAVLYVFWGISWTINDISYWSMLPSLSENQQEREKLGAFARICANIGLFAIVVGLVPITNAIATVTGSLVSAYQIFALALVVILLVFQAVTLFGVKVPERKMLVGTGKKNVIKELFEAVFKNDQLLFTAISMVLFQIGYTVTTSFGLYYFKYAFKNENMYPIFGAFVGVAQLVALSLFPLFSKRFTRRQLYSGATLLVAVSYLIFFFAPLHIMWVGSAGLLLFFGQAFIQLLMLMFLTDTIEYGELKLGKRNESVTLALQPFINKAGATVAAAVVNVTVVISGINSAVTPDDVTDEGIFIMKIAMMIFPLLVIVIGYIVYIKKYKIDKKMFEDILNKLQEKRN